MVPEKNNVDSQTSAYVDDPTIREVFADRLAVLSYEGGVVRMVLCASRASPKSESKDVPPYLTTAARLVMSPQGAAGLHAQLGQLLRAIEKRQAAQNKMRSEKASVSQGAETRPPRESSN